MNTKHEAQFPEQLVNCTCGNSHRLADFLRMPESNTVSILDNLEAKPDFVHTEDCTCIGPCQP